MLIQCTWYPHSGATHSLTKGEILRSALTTSQYMKLCDLPLPPEVLDLIPQPKQLHIITQPKIGDFLARQNRIKAILGDGNCFFRALSQVLYDSQDQHGKIRCKIVEYVADNPNIFAPLVTGQSSVEQHLVNMSTPGVWATQVEIQAATEVYGVPLYLKPSTTSYHWHCYSPRIRSQQYTVERINHIELAHPQQVHFEVVLDATTNKPCHTPPKLTGTTTVHPTVL